jgi:hypothetical protein
MVDSTTTLILQIKEEECSGISLITLVTTIKPNSPRQNGEAESMSFSESRVVTPSLKSNSSVKLVKLESFKLEDTPSAQESEFPCTTLCQSKEFNI